jgi:hypothetical protein
LSFNSWDIATDYQDYSQIASLAYTLFPEQKGENAFWQNAARIVVAAHMMSFTHRLGTNWSIADVYNAATANIDVQSRIIRGYPRGQDVVNFFLKPLLIRP